MILPWSAQQLIDELDRVFARARQQGDIEVQADYAKYLVIRVCGLMERAAEEVVSTFSRGQASASVAGHVAWRMKLFQNPTVERFDALLRSFVSRWADDFGTELTTEEREAIGSVGAHRNKIAHGEATNISLGQLDAYYTEIKTALKKFADPF